MRCNLLRATFLLALAAAAIPACSGDGGSVLVVTTPQTKVFLRVIGRYNTGRFNQGGSEIAAYDPASKRLFSVNAGTGAGGTVEVINLANPSGIAVPPGAALLNTINCATFVGAAGSPNSVACRNGLLAIAVQDGTTKSNPGAVVFFLANPADNYATPIATVPVGPLPDMLTFTPDGLKVIVANEGEPENNYAVDPAGSISVITVNFNAPAGTMAPTVDHVGFTAFDSAAQKAALRAAGVRISGLNTTGELDGVAQVSLDLEPESIAVSADSLTAYVTLQENNAMAIINLGAAPPVVTQIVALGLKDWNLPENTIDPTDRDIPGPPIAPLIRFVNGPVRGMYMPDGVASFQSGGQTFLVMANEGDSRDWGSFKDEVRLSTLSLDTAVFPNHATLKLPENFGRLNVTDKSGNTDGDPEFEQILTFGARSFSIRTAAGALVWDSGDDIERLMADVLPLNFNADHTASNAFDDRSDNKGPEPEGVTVGTLGSRTYAFVGLERVGGVLVYDVTTPSAPLFQTYVNTRDFGANPGAGAGPGLPVNGLDLGPEGLLFIPAADGPTGKALLIVSNEISGSIVIFQVDQITN